MNYVAFVIIIDEFGCSRLFVFATRQKDGIIYFKVSEDEYVVEIKDMNELTIIAFDLIKDEEVFDTFIIVNNVS